MKYCPNCGMEYRAGFEECSECLVGLVDERPEGVGEARPELRDRTVVFRSGRRIDAELVRARLEADGLDAEIWSSGLGPWMTVSALPEITGVPTDFNSHQVVIDATDVDRALELLQEVGEEGSVEDPESPKAPPTFLASLRKRWMLFAFAIFMLLVVILAGPVGN